MCVCEREGEIERESTNRGYIQPSIWTHLCSLKSQSWPVNNHLPRPKHIFNFLIFIFFLILILTRFNKFNRIIFLPTCKSFETCKCILCFVLLFRALCVYLLYFLHAQYFWCIQILCLTTRYDSLSKLCSNRYFKLKKNREKWKM